MSNIGVDAVLQQIRALSAEVKNGPVRTGEASGDVDFSKLLQQSIDNVNKLQQQSGKFSTAFERGEDNVSLAQVMIAKEKAGLAFDALTQVRNHLISAYKEVMNMPV